MISKKIREVRLKQKLSQGNFAKSLNYSKGYVADIESGRTKPSRQFLEALQKKYDISIDYVFGENRLLDLIELNKKSRDRLFLYSFSQEGIDRSEKQLLSLLGERKCIVVDCFNLRSSVKLMRGIVNAEGDGQGLWNNLQALLLGEETILILKNISTSRIPRSVDWVLSIFKIIDDASVRVLNGAGLPHLENIRLKYGNYSGSSLLLLDYPSYLEKHHNLLSPYTIPMYTGASLLDASKSSSSRQNL